VLDDADMIVYCAGELFWDGYVLIISNASGTYTPPMSSVEILAVILKQQLSGLEVRTMKFNDPSYLDLRSKLAL
jgi:hypothetical protein